MNPEILPDLAARYDVSAEHVTEFRRKGHILLRSIVSSEEAGLTGVSSSQPESSSERNGLPWRIVTHMAKHS
jgi:hypothetical protein